MDDGPSRDCLRRRPGVDAEIWVPPSPEARRLLRRAGALVDPDGPVGTLLRDRLVAPYAQLTLRDFALQYHLFELLHTRWTTRIGHAAGMSAFVLALLLSAHLVGGAPALVALTAVLMVWHASIAADARLPAWGGVAVAADLALAAGAASLARLEPTLGTAMATMLGSAALLALSHAAEPKQPPRVFPGDGWTSWRTGLAGPDAGSLGSRVALLARAALNFPFGLLNEAWAAPRLVHHNWLVLMFRLGYAPERWARIRGYVDRAWAHGNPALDYIGVGGGTTLRADR